MCPGCDWGIVWAAFNFVCGFAIIISNFSFSFCSILNIIIGLSIAWIAITHNCCDKFALHWFPLWDQSFFFMGCAFIYLSCGGWAWAFGGKGRNDDGWRSFQGILFFFIFVVGVLYLLFGLLIKFAGVGIPLPTPLSSCCGGGGSGGGGDEDDTKTDGRTNTRKKSGSAKKRSSAGGSSTKKKKKKKKQSMDA